MKQSRPQQQAPKEQSKDFTKISLQEAIRKRDLLLAELDKDLTKVAQTFKGSSRQKKKKMRRDLEKVTDLIWNFLGKEVKK